MFDHKLSHAHLPRELKSNSIGFKSGLICFLRQGRAGRAVARFPESGYRLRRHKTDISAYRARKHFNTLTKQINQLYNLNSQTDLFGVKPRPRQRKPIYLMTKHIYLLYVSNTQLWSVTVGFWQLIYLLFKADICVFRRADISAL